MRACFLRMFPESMVIYSIVGIYGNIGFPGSKLMLASSGQLMQM